MAEWLAVGEFRLGFANCLAPSRRPSSLLRQIERQGEACLPSPDLEARLVDYFPAPLIVLKVRASDALTLANRSRAAGAIKRLREPS